MATKEGKSNNTKSQNNFAPNLNSSYHINFKGKDALRGFAELMKGGKFHSDTEGFTVNKEHLALLDQANIPYKILRR